MKKTNEEYKRSEENHKMIVITSIKVQVDRIYKEKDEHCKKLNQRLAQEKTHQEILLQELREYKQKLSGKEQRSEIQRKEWDRVYGELRRELETLKREVEMLNEENARLKVPYTRLNKETQRMRHEIQLLWQAIEDNIKNRQKLIETRDRIDKELMKIKL